MSDLSITEMVREYFANTPPKEVARLWNEWGCGSYASAGEFLEEVKIESYEVKIPFTGTLKKEHFKGFCDHIAKQAQIYFAPATATTEQTLQDPRIPEGGANNNTLALAA